MTQSTDKKNLQNEVKLPTEQIDKPSILFWIERSKNKNIVVYEAKKSSNKLTYYDTIDGYWLDIDPEFVKKARSKGINHDRAELNYIEKKMAYGYSVKPNQNIKNEFICELVSLPTMPCVLKTDKNNNPKLETKINKINCYLRKVYVETKENWMGLPTVKFVDVYGYNIDNNEIVYEKIIPN